MSVYLDDKSAGTASMETVAEHLYGPEYQQPPPGTYWTGTSPPISIPFYAFLAVIDLDDGTVVDKSTSEDVWWDAEPVLEAVIAAEED